MKTYYSAVTPMGNSSYSYNSQEEADGFARELDENGCRYCSLCRKCYYCVGCLRCVHCSACKFSYGCSDCSGLFDALECFAIRH